VHIGRYEVALPLAEGPIGNVLLARDPILGRQVAIKVLRADAPLSADARARLVARVRESASAVAALSHPGFAALHDMGEDETGTPYLVFEHVRGPSLRERLATGPLAPAEVAAMGRALGSALTYAHGSDFVHGDVKPENVMLSPTGARLTEPGLASLAREQPVSPYDDQLGLAGVLYEALTGKSPFVDEPRRPPSAVRPNLKSFPNIDTIFDRALAKDPRKRFSSCDVLGGVLATELEGVGTGPLPPASVSSIVPRATRRWQNAAAGAAVLVIGALVLLGRQERHARGEGASLRTVSNAFFSAIGAARGAPTASAHHVRPAPAASSAPPSSGEPSGAVGADDSPGGWGSAEVDARGAATPP
jgi:eukaryotic-like serine/threonine-protein kinase